MSAESNPSRAGDGMCVSCGRWPARERDEERRCLFCAHTAVQCEIDTAHAVLHTVEAAVSEALNGFASPEDIGATVARAVSKMDTVPVRTVDRMLIESRALTRDLNAFAKSAEICGIEPGYPPTDAAEEES